MSFECSKQVRRLLRELAARAYERELRTLLEALETEFVRWRSGEIDSFELAEALDRFTRGPDRRSLDRRYETEALLHFNVARALVTGLLRDDEVPGEVREAIGSVVEFCREGLGDGSIELDGAD